MFSAMIALFYFLFGITFGSFFNVIGLRVPQKESIVHPPSHCPRCRHELQPLDLVPVIGYLFRRGKCAYCRQSISVRYPLIELLTGILFTADYLRFGLTPEGMLGLVLISFSAIFIVSDTAYFLLPNRIVLLFLICTAGARLFFHPAGLWSYLAGCVAGGGILLLFHLIRPDGMGMGDVKLFAVYGLALGIVHMLLALFIASVIAVIIGSCLLAVRRLHRKQPIPFGPFLAAGSLIVYGYGGIVLQWYLFHYSLHL